jgi:hypothetical protein
MLPSYGKEPGISMTPVTQSAEPVCASDSMLTAILKKFDLLFVVAAQPQPQTTGSAFSDIALEHR